MHMTLFSRYANFCVIRKFLWNLVCVDFFSVCSQKEMMAVIFYKNASISPFSNKII